LCSGSAANVCLSRPAVNGDELSGNLLFTDAFELEPNADPQGRLEAFVSDFLPLTLVSLTLIFVDYDGIDAKSISAQIASHMVYHHNHRPFLYLGSSV
jgi:hypothetical protein